MPSFATPADLASALQVASVDTATAQLKLDNATAAIKSHCGWSILQESFTADARNARGGRSLFLPTLRLTAVANVVADGIALTEGTDYEWWSYGELERLGKHWPRKPRSVVLDWTHGFTTLPADLKGVCLSLAGRGYLNPTGAKSTTQTAGPFIEGKSYAEDPSSLLNAAEIQALGPYKRERFA